MAHDSAPIIYDAAMADEPVDRLRGLGLLVQLLPALTFSSPASMLVMYALGEFRTPLALLSSAPLASLLVQFVTGWVIVHRRPRAVPFAIVSVVVAIGLLGLDVAMADDTDPPSIVAMALSTAGWPVATLIAVLRGPRTPYVSRRADLGGAVLGYGLLLLLFAGLTIATFAINAAPFELEPWQLVVFSSPILALAVAAVFAILAGAELARAPRPGRSRLTMYLIVATIVTVLVLAVSGIGMLADRRGRFDSLAMQIALLVLGIGNLYAAPLVIWRYARRAKPLDVADSAAAAGVLRWTALYFAIAMTEKLVQGFAGEESHFTRRMARILSDLDALGGFVLGAACAQVVLAIVAFATKSRRLAMWMSLAICALAVVSLASMIIGGDALRRSDAIWPSAMTIGPFAALAWLNRPRVRNERSLAAIFE
jgi:hypothetical protein